MPSCQLGGAFFFLNRNILFSLTRGERAVQFRMDSKSTIGSDARATLFCLLRCTDNKQHTDNPWRSTPVSSGHARNGGAHPSSESISPLLLYVNVGLKISGLYAKPIWYAVPSQVAVV